MLSVQFDSVIQQVSFYGSFLKLYKTDGLKKGGGVIAFDVGEKYILLSLSANFLIRRENRLKRDGFFFLPPLLK